MAIARQRPLTILLIVGRVVFGLLFLAAAGFKLTAAPQMVAEFDQIGLGQWFRVVTGLIEVAGALLLSRPATVFIGAALLTIVSVGAFVAQAMILHGDVVHTIVFAVLLAGIAYAYRPGRV